MSPEQLEAAQRLLELKLLPRAGWTRYPIPAEEVESVAAHSYGVALLAMLFCPKGLDRLKVLEMALVHDLAEVATGDLTPHDGVEPEWKEARERDALRQLTARLPDAERLCSLAREYQQGMSPEARWVKASDKLDMALQSRLYESRGELNLEEFRRSARPVLKEWGLD